MGEKIKISIPLINTIKHYKKPWLRKDLIAGITVAAVAVPQAMAYSQLAGLPLITGTYTALISMLLFAVFTTSRLAGIVGPDAAMAALTGAAILPLASGNPGEYFVSSDDAGNSDWCNLPDCALRPPWLYCRIYFQTDTTWLYGWSSAGCDCFANTKAVWSSCADARHFFHNWTTYSSQCDALQLADSVAERCTFFECSLTATIC